MVKYVSVISKVSKLKNFGIFHEFSWKEELPQFKKLNLIYGWNRSGKTTFSRVFASCEKRSLYSKDLYRQYPENGEFEIKIADDSILKSGDVETSNILIKVFNQDFIDDNISFDSSDICNPIVYISEEDIETKKQLEILKSKVESLSQAYQIAKSNAESSDKIENNFRISVAQTITQLLTDKTNRDRYFSYDKSKVKEKIAEIGRDHFTAHILTEDDLKKVEAISKSEEGIVLESFSKLEFEFLFEEQIINNFDGIFTAIQLLLGKKVVSETLDRLKDDSILNNWVKQGFDLHISKAEKDNCLFCQKPLDASFLESLSKHFSKDYADLQAVITSLKTKISLLKRDKIPLMNENIHPDLKDEYSVQAEKLNTVIEKLNSWIDISVSKLTEKHTSPLLIIEDPEKSEDFLTPFNEATIALNYLVSKHNEKRENHATEVKDSREKLELHTIAVALSEQDYVKMETDVVKAQANEKTALGEITKNNNEISRLEKQTSNIGEAIGKINTNLKEFFGREEIKLELDPDKRGYVINRNSQHAKNLSEGEKTAIAFSYFIAKTEERGFKIKEGIIFIDDPISSLDSNFTYHSFSLIKTHFSDVGQLFISTHNFQFFNLIKEWFLRKNKNTEEDNKNRKLKGQEEKICPCEFYMIKNETTGDQRKAKLILLDNTLKNNKSEYSFLFSLLKNFNEKIEDPSFEEIYNIANIGRRFFDIFADFKIPTNAIGQEGKLDILVKEINDTKKEDEDKISKTTCGKMLWLLNGFSHNSDPTSTIEHKDKNESKEAVKILLDIVKDSDPKHYEILLKEAV